MDEESGTGKDVDGGGAVGAGGEAAYLGAFHRKELAWLQRAEPWDGIDPLLAAGMAAYAFRQASVYRSLADRFTSIWATPYKSRQRVPDRIEFTQEEEEEESNDEEEGLAEARALADNREDPTLND